jgi:hypothetical protein
MKLGIEESSAEQLSIELRSAEALNETPKHPDCVKENIVLPEMDKNGAREVGAYEVLRNGKREGWMRLELVGERLQISMSLAQLEEPGATKYLRGFVHPISGSGCIYGAAAALAGWPWIPSGEAKVLTHRIDEGGEDGNDTKTDRDG